MATIRKFVSKSGKTYTALFVNDVIVTFDILTMCKAGNMSPLEITSLNVGDEIKI